MPPVGRARMTSVDALRGVAALGVLGMHAVSFTGVGPREYLRLHPPGTLDVIGWLGWMMMPLWFGGFGVVLFFVLSGYCIHRNQARRLAVDPEWKDFGVGRYLVRRFWRIYPTYVAGLVVAGVLRYVVLPYLGSRGYALYAAEAGAQHSWKVLGISLAAMQNVLPFPTADEYHPADCYESVYWTLSLEIHFYLLYPLVLMVIRRLGAINMVILSLAVAILWDVLHAIYSQVPVPCFFLRLTLFAPYWFTWCLGTYVAEMEAEGQKAQRLWTWGLGAGLLAAGLWAAGRHFREANLTLGYVREIPLGVLAGVIVLWSLNSKRAWLWRSGAARVLAFAGMFSYSLYAIHYSCLRVYRALVGAQHASYLPAVAGILVVVPVAYLFFLLVERWTLRTSERPGGQRMEPEQLLAHEGAGKSRPSNF